MYATPEELGADPDYQLNMYAALGGKGQAADIQRQAMHTLQVSYAYNNPMDAIDSYIALCKGGACPTRDMDKEAFLDQWARSHMTDVGKADWEWAKAYAALLREGRAPLTGRESLAEIVCRPDTEGGPRQ